MKSHMKSHTKSLMKYLIFAILLFPLFASAQVDLGNAVTAVTDTATATATTLVKDIVALTAADQAHNTTATHVAAAAIIAFLLKLILDQLVKFKNTKKFLPFICSGVGLVVAVLSRFGAGSSWVDAFIVGLSGPGAVLANEIGNAITSLSKNTTTTTTVTPSTTTTVVTTPATVTTSPAQVQVEVAPTTPVTPVSAEPVAPVSEKK